MSHYKLSTSSVSSSGKMAAKPSTADQTPSPTLRRMSHLEARKQSSVIRKFSRSSRHSSMTGHGPQFRPQARIANTYRMEPPKHERFKAASVQRMMEGILSAYLGGESYSRFMCISLTKSLTEVIKDRMKDLGFSPRYRYVVMVTIGEKKEQGVCLASRCVWNADTDSFASASYKQGDLFAVATVYAVYLE